MSNPNFLMVPMVVEALVVNQSVRIDGTPFLRNQMRYNGLWKLDNAEPGFDDNDLGFMANSPVGPFGTPAADYFNGVYLKWRLPSYFTRGARAGAATFAETPNRWMVMRYSGTGTPRDVAAWIVESDYLWPQPPQPANVSQSGSHYVIPVSASDPTPVQNFIGRNTPLGGWSEPGTSLGLRAVAPGNPSFSAYQPRCNNVFSFMDPINQYPAQTLSYMVLGWFSDATADPLYGVTPQNFLERLKEIGWSLPAGTPPGWTADRCMIEGVLTGVEWQTTSAPKGGLPEGRTAVAIGNTAVQALTALIAGQSEQMGVDMDPSILEAFQLGLIDELDQPNGQAVVDQAILSSYFSRYNGGHAWTIVDAPDADETPDSMELEKEAAWLAVLNDDQTRLDDAIRNLASLQAQLYTMWWKYLVWPTAHRGVVSPIPPLNDRDNLAQQLDPARQGSLAQQTAAALASVDALLDDVPHGDTPAELDAAIEDYARKEHGLPLSRQLKRHAQPAFFEANNPVALIAGAGATGIVDPAGQTLCRATSQIVTGFRIDPQIVVTAQTPGLKIPHPDLSGVSGVPWTPELIESLVNEMFFLDPNDADTVAEALPGMSTSKIRQSMEDPKDDLDTYPSGGVTAWTGNPWHPLRLLYRLRYYPIAYSVPGSPSWEFADGSYYWNGDPSSVGTPATYSGVIQLSPAASFNMESRIKKFLADNPYLPAEERDEFEALLKFVQEDDEWNILSQALNGLRDQMQLQTPGAFMGPGVFPLPGSAPLADLVGDERGWSPNIGNISPQLNPPTWFQQWRAGQFVMTDLVLVDEWGQALWLVSDRSANRVELYLPPDLMPVVTSAVVTFPVTATPILNIASPSMATQGSGNLVVTLTGAGFVPSDVAAWNGLTVTTLFVSDTALHATLAAGDLKQAGTNQITVVRSGKASAPLGFDVVSGPAIASLSPNIVLAGMAESADFPVEVTGLNFGPGAVVEWNGTPVETEYVSPTQLTAHIPSANVATRGVAGVRVVDKGGAISAGVNFIIAAVATIAELQPAAATLGGGWFTMEVRGAGFEPLARVQWNNTALDTTFIDSTHLQAVVPETFLGAAGTIAISMAIGHCVLPQSADLFVQLGPSLLQPARLAFDLLSAIAPDPTVDTGPLCGWVVPNHLDHSLAAYSGSGLSFGELAVGASVAGVSTVCWHPAPNSPYPSLEELALNVPDFGPFLLELRRQTPEVFVAFLRVVDETLWGASPAGSGMDDSLTALIGRPLAMMVGTLQFELNGTPQADPSWQFTFSPAAPLVEAYRFAVELGDIANIEDGLVGYFLNSDYRMFNVVKEAGSGTDSYMRPIGVDDNYIYLPADGKTFARASMLVDPRAAVHARSGIVPDASVAAPPPVVTAVLSSMSLTFRIDTILTDQQTTAAATDALPVTTLFMPYPKVPSGTWTWVEYDDKDAVSYLIATNGAAATLSTSQPVLRQGVLQLTGANADSATGKTVRRQLRSAKRTHQI